MLQTIKNLFKKGKSPDVVHPRKNHRKYESGGMWGYNITISKTLKNEKGLVKGFKVIGHWTPRPREGDILLWNMESGRRSVSVFTDVHYYSDPHDMFRGTTRMIGYEDEVFLPNGNFDMAYINAWNNWMQIEEEK